MNTRGAASGRWSMSDIDVCPSEDVLVGFLSGALSRAEVGNIEQHLGACAPCFDLVTVALGGSHPAAPVGDAPGPERQFGPYRILGRLGRGGMGVVYRALDTRTGAEVALKTVRADAPHATDAIRREVRMVTRVCHPGIVRVIDQSGCSAAAPWYVMELVPGKTLAERLAAPHVDRVALLRIARRLCSTLAALHTAAIVHRDVSPRNVILRHDDSPVLVDFGLAVDSEGTAVARENLRLEEVGAGTLRYMAPEQIRGGRTDPRTDVYSLGCILYEIVTGQAPFPGTSRSPIVNGHLSGDVIPPSHRVPDLSPALDALVVRMLAKDPRDRLPYADEVGRILDEVLGASGTETFEREPYLYRPRLVGREQNLAALNVVLARCEEGRGGLMMVVGESGTGKTRLVAELAAEAARRRFEVVLGACGGLALEQGQPRASNMAFEPLQPLLALLAQRCREGGPQATARLLGLRGRVLAELEPSLRRAPGLEHLPALPVIAGEAGRVRTLDALEHALGELTRSGPILLVLDDLQWADDLSLELLLHLGAGFFAQHPLVIVGTCRQEEMGPKLAARLARPDVPTMRLGTLDDTAILTMARDMLATPALPDELGATIVQQAAGNPFFVVEFLRTALAERTLERQGARWIFAPRSDAAEPSSAAALKRLIGRRLAQLSARSRRLLEGAAVLGREVSGDLLLEVVAGVDDPTAGLAELVAAQVLEPAERGAYRFVHDKLREITYEGVALDARRALHRRAAAAIEAAGRLAAHDGGIDVALATHYGAAGDDARAIHHLGRSAEQALRAGTVGDAAALADRALRLCARGQVTLPAAALARLHRMRAQAAFALADLEACRRHAQAALQAIGQPPPAAAAGGLRVLASASVQALIRALPLGRPSLRRDEPSEEGAAAAGLLASTMYFTGDWFPMTAVLALGGTLAHRAGSSAEMVGALSRLGYIAGVSGFEPVARRFFAAAARQAESAADASALALTRYLHALHHIGRGRWREAEEAGQEAVRLLDGIGDLQDGDLARTIVAHAWFFQGRVQPAAAQYLAIEQSARRRANQQHLGWGLALRARSLLALGDAEQALPLLEQARQVLSPLPDRFSIAICEGLLASAQVALGRLAEGVATAEALAERLSGPILPLAACLHGYLGAVDAALSAWARNTADDLAAARARLACRNLRRFARLFPMARPFSARARATVVALEGRARTAAKLARRADADARALRMFTEFQGSTLAGLVISGR